MHRPPAPIKRRVGPPSTSPALTRASVGERPPLATPFRPRKSLRAIREPSARQPRLPPIPCSLTLPQVGCCPFPSVGLTEMRKWPFLAALLLTSTQRLKQRVRGISNAIRGATAAKFRCATRRWTSFPQGHQPWRQSRPQPLHPFSARQSRPWGPVRAGKPTFATAGEAVASKQFARNVKNASDHSSCQHLAR
jgi:hypothetical protein